LIAQDEIKYFSKKYLAEKYEKLSPIPSDHVVLDTDIFVSYPDNKYKKEITVCSFHMNEEKDEIIFFNKPILYDGYFDTWSVDKTNTSQKIDTVDEKGKKVSASQSFNYQAIILKQIDETSTLYTHIELFPKDPKDVLNKTDQFNIIKKHIGKKQRLKSNLNCSNTVKFKQINKNDPIGKLLYNFLSQNDMLEFGVSHLIEFLTQKSIPKNVVDIFAEKKINCPSFCALKKKEDFYRNENRYTF